MYYFMRSSRRLASEMATSNSMRESLQFMNRELVHRVGNLLAVAQGIIRLSYDASGSAVEFKESILARLNALHQSVGLINREDWRGVWLHELLQTELAPVMDRIDLSGCDALLKPKAAQSLSLLFYELMTNSSKHGALSKHGGRVTAEWEFKDTEAGRLFCFRWQEHGHGIIKPPTRQGFGTKLLTRLVSSDLLGRATLNYELGGFGYELQAPVECVVERESNAEVNVKAVAPCASSADIQMEMKWRRSPVEEHGFDRRNPVRRCPARIIASQSCATHRDRDDCARSMHKRLKWRRLFQ